MKAELAYSKQMRRNSVCTALLSSSGSWAAPALPHRKSVFATKKKQRKLKVSALRCFLETQERRCNGIIESKKNEKET